MRKGAKNAFALGFCLLFWLDIFTATCAGGIITGDWKAQNSGTTYSLYSVSAVSQTRVFAVGGDNNKGVGILLKTTNGGATWKDAGTTFTRNVRLNKVSFIDSKEGWITPMGVSYLIHTIDGGETWQQLFNNYLPNDMISHQFVTAKRGWVNAIGAYLGCVMRTDDGGLSWHDKNTGLTEWIVSFYFIDQFAGYAVNNWGVLWKTTDGGDHWLEINNVGNGNSSCQQFAFLNSQIGWFAYGNWNYDFNSSLQSTTDGFKTSHLVNSVNNANAVFLLDAKNLWVIGRPRLTQNNCASYFSVDEGQTWKEYDSATPNFLYATHFCDANHGWAVGEKGTIVKFFHPSSAAADKNWLHYR